VTQFADVTTKLGAARTRLILEKPFIGALVMHLPLVAADRTWCQTIATDGRAFYFNPAYIAELDFAQTQFVLAHEAMHCALAHFDRRNHRSLHRWDIAADHAVNLLLVDDGLRPPPGALLNTEFRGLSAEEIYPLVPPDSTEATLDRHVFNENTGPQPTAGNGGGSARGQPRRDRIDVSRDPQSNASGTWDDAGDEGRSRPERHAPPELSASEREALACKWQGRLAAAAQQARQAGRMGEPWLRRIHALLGPRLPWRQLLARYMVSLARDDYSFQRLSRREGDALLPRLASEQIDLYIVLDTSASIADEELAEFAAEVDALKGQIRARVTLQACDEHLDPRGPWIFQAWERFILPDGLRGGGGTCFKPAFEWVTGQTTRPGVMVYFTDAVGAFPERAPEYPVIWLVKGSGKVPWGERIQLN
jgi:predicted metal-dependent peptidase